MSETTKKKTKTNKFKKYTKVMWGTYFCFLLAVIVFFVLLSLGVLGFMPTFEQLENTLSLISIDSDVIITLFNFLHPRKHDSLILIFLELMITSSKFILCEKEYDSIISTDSVMIIFFKY